MSQDYSEEIYPYHLNQRGDLFMKPTKTKKGAAKRFKITSSGKILRKGGYSSHLKEKKSGSRNRRHEEPELVSPADRKRLVKLLNK